MQENNIKENSIKFEDMPKAMSWIMDKLNELDSKIDILNGLTHGEKAEKWMNLEELCKYLPSHPAEQTVYGWTSSHQIPFHKRGKRIMFALSEVDKWLEGGKIKSQEELQEDALNFIRSRRCRR